MPPKQDATLLYYVYYHSDVRTDGRETRLEGRGNKHVTKCVKIDVSTERKTRVRNVRTLGSHLNNRIDKEDICG